MSKEVSTRSYKSAPDQTYKSVLHERQRVVGNLSNQLNPLRLGRVVDAALKDAATVTVRGDLDTVRRDGVVHKLVVLRGQMVQALLNDMVAVEV